MKAFARGADLLTTTGQFTEQEYRRAGRLGALLVEHAVAWPKHPAAGGALVHHDPMRTTTNWNKMTQRYGGCAGLGPGGLLRGRGALPHPVTIRTLSH